MAADEATGSGSGGETSSAEPTPPPIVEIDGQSGGDPVISITLDAEAGGDGITTSDLFEALDFLTETGNRGLADELALRYEAALRDDAIAVQKQTAARRRSQSAEQRADAVPTKAEPVIGFTEAPDETYGADDGMTLEDPLPQSIEPSTPSARADDNGRRESPDPGLSSQERAAPDSIEGKSKPAYTTEQFINETKEFFDKDSDYYIHDWIGIPRRDELDDAAEGIRRTWDGLSDPEVINNVKAPTVDSVIKKGSIGDLATKPRFRPKFPGTSMLKRAPKPTVKPKAATPTNLSRKSGTRADSNATRKPTTGYRKVKVVERTKAYRRLEDKRVDGKPVLETKRAVTSGAGGKFQSKVSGGKDVEYVGRLKRGIRRPDGKKVRKTVQVDDLRQADDGRLVLVEAKHADGAIDLPDSGHVRFGTKDKVDHVRRLIRFARENPDDVNRIEIWVNRTGNGPGITPNAAEIYKEILVRHFSTTDQALVSIKYF